MLSVVGVGLGSEGCDVLLMGETLRHDTFPNILGMLERAIKRRSGLTPTSQSKRDLFTSTPTFLELGLFYLGLLPRHHVPLLFVLSDFSHPPTPYDS